MSPAPEPAVQERTGVRIAEILVALALVTLGSFVIYETQSIRETQSVSGVGPRLFPYIIGAGLTLIGGWLGWQALVGGWRDVPHTPEHAQPDWLAFGAIALGVVLHMILIGWAGFKIAAFVLFMLIAFGFGSRRTKRDLIVALLVAVVVYLFFTHVLGLSLPAGLFEGVL
ncbi:tripartite tricarboxylate transporter TctB family protein [Piscinibacter sp.]|uniref:tripartite tricarboxylate transporter TctB family protein n=1 Tax=Piscinibacter sp. TaxID=1903157 RepID=UPI002C850C6D|nr:tripartite tricarboxylate transporter TctB family protein [Albitalea sp.]HUG24472.1 tripartite tricarboxylate transporter TctB family protein [Albitalea sp.]